MKTEVEKIVVKYCNDILKNIIPSCLYVKKAIKRFDRDMRNTKQGEFFFNWEKVQEFYDFSKLIKLPDRDEYLQLLPWQLFIFANLLGFYYKNDPEKRRFRKGAVFVPRKNGKTTGLLFPLLLYDFITSQAAESYMFEKDEKQAEKLFLELKYIINQNELLKDNVVMTQNVITMQGSRISFFTSESGGLDSYRPSMNIVDEYWCFPNNKPITSMVLGSKARKNSLSLVISTAGTDISLPAYEEWQICEKILNGVLDNDSYFALLYTIDQNDDQMTEESYIKANPSYGFGFLDSKVMYQDLQDAIAIPSRKPDYLAKTLNVWTAGQTTWIPLERLAYLENIPSVNWNEFDATTKFYTAFDLSDVDDFTAYTLCCKFNDKFYFKHRFYIPASTVQERYQKENIGILEWIEKGIVSVIPGRTIDYDFIFRNFQQDMERFNIQEVAYDNYHARELINMIENEYGDNITTFAYPQNLRRFSAPTKQYEKKIFDELIVDLNPVMTWMLTNVEIQIDVNNNYKPLKRYRSSNKRIDGVITSIMALDRCIVNSNNIVENNLTFEELKGLF